MSISVKDIIDNKVYLGTLKNDAHPKTNKNRAGIHNSMVVLDPEILVEKLQKAKDRVSTLRKEWKVILVVCEKKMYADEIEKLSEIAKVSYLNYKVPAGFLTNFDTLKKRIQSMNDMVDFMKWDEFSALTKKEQVIYKRKLERIKKIYKWVKGILWKPDLVIVIGGSMLNNFIEELKKTKMDNIVIASSDFKNRWDDDNLIIANTESYKSMDFIMKTVLS